MSHFDSNWQYYILYLYIELYHNYIYKCWHEFECQAFHFFSEKGFFIAFMPCKARTVTSSQPTHRKANRFREVSEGTISKLYKSVQGHWQRIVTMQAFVQQDFFVAASRQTQTITHQTHPNISKLILVIDNHIKLIIPSTVKTAPTQCKCWSPPCSKTTSHAV